MPLQLLSYENKILFFGEKMGFLSRLFGFGRKHQVAKQQLRFAIDVDLSGVPEPHRARFQQLLNWISTEILLLPECVRDDVAGFMSTVYPMRLEADINNCRRGVVNPIRIRYTNPHTSPQQIELVEAPPQLKQPISFEQCLEIVHEMHRSLLTRLFEELKQFKPITQVLKESKKKH